MHGLINYWIRGWSIEFSHELSTGELPFTPSGPHLPYVYSYLHVLMSWIEYQLFYWRFSRAMPICFKMKLKDVGVKLGLTFWLMYYWSYRSDLSSPCRPTWRLISGVFPKHGPSNAQVNSKKMISRKTAVRKKKYREDYSFGFLLNEVSYHNWFKSPIIVYF